MVASRHMTLLLVRALSICWGLYEWARQATTADDHPAMALKHPSRSWAMHVCSTYQAC